ncbi:MAG: AI-2E family transporter [Pyrinomonadaceae bacterium]
MPEKKDGEKNNETPKDETRPNKKTGREVFLSPAMPSSWTVVRVVIVAFIVWNLGGIVTSILSSLTNLFFMIVVSIFFAYLIDPLVKFIRRPFKQRNLEKLMPRPLAIVIAYLFVFSVLGIGIANLAPRIADQAREFAENLPGYSTIFQDRLTEINNRYDRLQISEDFQEKISERFNSLIDKFATFLTTMIFGVYLLNLISFLPWIILVPILSFFFLKDIHFFKTSFLGCFPSGRWRARAESVLNDVNKTLAAYTRAQLISCLLIGFICTVVFSVIGVKYSLLLGILAGICEFVPLIGPLIIGILATSVAGFSGSSWQALWTASFLIGLRLLHDYVTYPRIVREGVHLHPMAVILSILAGEQLAGIPGVFLSIPIVALLTVVYRHILEHTGSEGFFAGWLEPKEEGKES